MFIFALLCGASKGVGENKTFIKPFEAPQRSVKIKIELKIFTLSGIGTLRVEHLFLPAYIFGTVYSAGKIYAEPAE